MKKWMLSTAFLLILAACNASPQTEQTSEGENNNVEDIQTEKVEETSDEAVEEQDEEAESEMEPDEMESPLQPQYTVNLANSAIEPIGGADAEVVLLTIDDAPEHYALEMAKTLKNLNVSAIFFVNGHFLQTEEQQSILKEIYEMGFPIGNHTMNHQNLNQQSEEEQYEAIVGLSDLIEDIIGERPKFFRAPFGENTDYSNELVAKEGMVRMNWTYGYDWEKEYTSAQALADIMVNTDLLRSGANLLMHDREWTNEALEDIVKGLQEKGYEIVDPQLIEVPSEE